MNNKIEIFDTAYVDDNQTKIAIEKKSETKEFIKEPISPDSMRKYGTSKPTRIIIKAKITDFSGEIRLVFSNIFPL